MILPTFFFFLLFCDQVSKLLASQALHDGLYVHYNFLLSFYLTANQGVALGLLSSLTYPFMLCLHGLFCVFIFTWCFSGKNQSFYTTMPITTTLILAGATGNFFDRLFYGYVVDFIWLHFGTHHWITVINFADLMIILGILNLIFFHYNIFGKSLSS